MLLADGRFPAGGHAHSAGAESACADGRIVDEPTLAAFVEGRLRTTGLVDAALAAATALALAGCTTEDDVRLALAALDPEADARIAAPPLRAASRRLGRQLVRVAGRCWPDGTLALVPDALPDGAHQAVALGAVGLAAGLDAGAVAGLSLHHSVTTPAQAAVRLLGLDPFGVAAITAQLGPVAEQVAAEAVAAARAALYRGIGSARDPHPTAVPAEFGAVPEVAAAAPCAVADHPDGDLSATRNRFAGLADLPALSGPLVDIAAIEHRTWDVRMFAT